MLKSHAFHDHRLSNIHLAVLFPGSLQSRWPNQESDASVVLLLRVRKFSSDVYSLCPFQTWKHRNMAGDIYKHFYVECLYVLSPSHTRLGLSG